MAIVHWEPVRELGSIQGEMNRLFNTMFEGSGGSGGTGNTRRWAPPMDLIEATDHFLLKVDLPGLADSDVSIEVEDGTLTISGERKSAHESQEGGVRRFERAFGTFSRSVTLPQGLDPERVTAEFDRGVLSVRIPKPEERKPRKIAIGVGSSPATLEGQVTANGGGETASNGSGQASGSDR
jgi:HSP20 family protein